MTFNYAAFQATFAAARRIGVDLDHCTSYQRALVAAELRRAQTVSAADYGWWRDRDIFSEKEAPIAKIITPIPVAQPQPIAPSFNLAELLNHVRRELIHEAPIPLKQVHQRQRAKWVEGAGLPMRMMV